ncbi:hypothetical protein DM02DRAFT_662830 [Periconia macrospinosa]|uniref:Heterokaryon incompatibility domain-containing protein n=1 Tax=Periconia macrospinosa TaxID=97972 RepID=A0A2V1D3H3_9PLEO|nr:hypothetical protein DM02DRAFT_662830 [Periconia macrospinosa]
MLNVEPEQAEGVVKYYLHRTRWITRGWTLQELIAPRYLVFYDKNWDEIGDRITLASALSSIIDVDTEILQRPQYVTAYAMIPSFSIAKRMSWAGGRNTTRPEDIAYCLLGLFDVHIPLLYGEGGDNPFFRLQEEIMKQSMDLSILAWGRPGRQFSELPCGALAASPADFYSSPTIIHFPEPAVEPFQVTNKGLRISLPIVKTDIGYLAILLNCRNAHNLNGPLAIRVSPPDPSQSSNHVHHRLSSGLFTVKKSDRCWPEEMEEIYLRFRRDILYRGAPNGVSFRIALITDNDGIRIRELVCTNASYGDWNPKMNILRLSEQHDHPDIYLFIYDKLVMSEHLPSIPIAKLVIIKQSDDTYQCGIMDHSSDFDSESMPPDSLTVQGSRLEVKISEHAELVMGDLVHEIWLVRRPLPGSSSHRVGATQLRSS